MFGENERTKPIQEVRRSEFIYRYGPGSLIETRAGTLIFSDLKSGFGKYFSTENFTINEIKEARFKSVFKSLMSPDDNIEIHLFKFPPEFYGNFDSNEFQYLMKSFPEWKICENVEKHRDKCSEGCSILYSGNKCPVCEDFKHSSQVRFVMACNEGHLDDIKWDEIFKKFGFKCTSNYFYWIVEGSSLEKIKIRCPNNPNESLTMSKVYYGNYKCTGRHPWNTDKKNDNCGENMYVVLKNYSGLYIPQTVTFFTWPDERDNIRIALQDDNINNTISHLIIFKEQQEDKFDESFKRIFDDLEKKYKGKMDILEKIKNIRDFYTKNGWNELEKIYHELESSQNKSFTDNVIDEYRSLLKYAEGGERYIIKEKSGFQDSDEILPSFDIYSIQNMILITAQIGFTRIIKPTEKQEYTNKIVDIGVSVFSSGKWYPAIRRKTEGIFFSFKDFKSKIKSRGNNSFFGWGKPDGRNTVLEKIWSTEYLTDPGFVFLHTLSHSFIKSLSAFAGYSMGSLRERVYFDRNSESGGFIIYPSSTGSDSSLGSLISLVKNEYLLRDAVSTAVKNIEICSNDPLCFLKYKNENTSLGAACYSCLLLSETSCEYGNRYLDRHLIFGDELWK